MRKTITANYLKKLHACPEAIESFQAQEERDTIKILRKCLQISHFDWANWLIVELMNRKQRLKYAVHAAELVLPAWEERYPNDKRPRETIQAAKKVLKRNSRGNREAAYVAADAADAAVDHAVAEAAYVAADVADAAFWTAYAAGRAAAWTARTARVAWTDYTARMAAAAVADVVADAEAKIIEYGITLLGKE